MHLKNKWQRESQQIKNEIEEQQIICSYKTCGNEYQNSNLLKSLKYRENSARNSNLAESSKSGPG